MFQMELHKVDSLNEAILASTHVLLRKIILELTLLLSLSGAVIILVPLKPFAILLSIIEFLCQNLLTV